MFFVLTGYDDYGWTEVQVAETLNLHPEEYRFRFLNILHWMQRELEKKSKEYPLLYIMCKKSERHHKLTISTAKTLDLFQQGHTIDDISRIRRLKKNTIEDHFIEIIFSYKDFNTTSFITDEALEKVAVIMKEEHTKRLKPIKDRLPNLSYFQIRVAMAKAGEQS